MRKLRILGISLIVLLLCSATALAATPFETRTGWLYRELWVNGATGNAIDLTQIAPDAHSNAIYIINDCDNNQATLNTVFINWSGVDHASSNTSRPVSATTADYALKEGEELWMDPWTTNRIEVTGNTGTQGGIEGGGFIRVLILYTDN